ncbi:MAG: cyclic nucleotide-binding domain-containing protein [Gemmataceae bacterium]
MKKILFLLGQLDDPDVDWLVSKGSRRRLDKGAVLIAEGGPISDLFIVLDGALEVKIAALGVVDQMTCGDVAGEISFLDNRPPSATVAALQPSVVLAVPRVTMAAKLGTDAAFAARFYKSLAMFLSHRLRVRNQQRKETQTAIDLDLDLNDELDGDVLDEIHLAAGRFDRVLRRLLGT